MIKLATSFAAQVFASRPCAAEDLYTGRYATCMDKAGGFTVEMINCIGEELKQQDTRLNSAYKKLDTQMSGALK